MAHIVKAELVQAKKQDGTYVHVYKGGVLPDDIDESQLAQLVESEMVEEGDAETGDAGSSKRSRRSSSDG